MAGSVKKEMPTPKTPKDWAVADFNHLIHRGTTVNGMSAYLTEMTMRTYLMYANISHSLAPQEAPVSLEKFMTDTMNDVAASIRLGIKNGEITVTEDAQKPADAQVIETTAEVKSDGKE